MSTYINRVRVFGFLGAAALLLYPFIDVASTFACGGSGSACGG